MVVAKEKDPREDKVTNTNWNEGLGKLYHHLEPEISPVLTDDADEMGDDNNKCDVWGVG